MSVVVDIHNHFFPESWENLAERFGEPDWPWMKHLGCGKAVLMVGDKEFRPVGSATWDARKRLEELDRAGIDHQAMSATPVLFAYLRKPAHALDCARMFNDMALDMCARSDGRIHAVAQVPLQDIDASCREVERAIASGHIGVELGSHVGDSDFDDEGIITFLQHCANISCPVLEHPWDMMGGARMSRYLLKWLVAMPAETHLAMLSLILSGAMDRIPEALRISFAHGGGSFAFALGRADNAWRHHDIVRKHSPRPPSSYTRRFWVDSAVFDERALDYLISVMGDDHIMTGTDYPYAMGEEQMSSLVRNARHLDSHQKTGILGENASLFCDRAFDKRTSNASSPRSSSCLTKIRTSKTLPINARWRSRSGTPTAAKDTAACSEGCFPKASCRRFLN